MRAKHLRLAFSSLVVAALCAVLPAVAGAVNYVSIGDSYTLRLVSRQRVA